MRRNVKAWTVFVACGMFLIVIIFTTATLLMRARLNTTEQALSLARNGAPSVRHVAAARSSLRELREALGAEHLGDDLSEVTVVIDDEQVGHLRPYWNIGAAGSTSDGFRAEASFAARRERQRSTGARAK